MRVSLVVQMVKNLSAMPEIWVWSLCPEDLLRREWLPIPILLSGEFHGQRSLVATVHGVSKSWTLRIDAFNSGVGEDSWESFGLQGDPTSPSLRKSALNIHWKDWCWSWNSRTSATWCKELIHLKRPWCYERLKVGGEGDDRAWDG